MLRRLEKFPIDRGGEVSFQYLAVRSVGMMKLGIGIMHHLDSMSDCIKIVLRYKGYTLKDKLHFVMGSGLALKCLWDFVMQTDFVKQVPRLEIPVYIFQGRFDYQVSYSVAQKYVPYYPGRRAAGKMRFGGWIKLEMSQKTLFYKEKVVDTSGRV